MSLVSLQTIIESLLFVSEHPLDVTALSRISEATTEEIRPVLDALMAESEASQRGFVLVKVGGGYQYRTRPEFSPWIQKLIGGKPARLSATAMETLTIIAYNGPITRAEIEKIRGVKDVSSVLRKLLDMKLVRIVGKQKDLPGQPLVYKVTKHFLEVFNLESIADLPTLRDIDEMMREEAGDSRNQLGLEGIVEVGEETIEAELGPASEEDEGYARGDYDDEDDE